LTKTPTIGLTDPAYEKLVRTKPDLLIVLRALFCGSLSTKLLAKQTEIPLSTVKELASEGKKKGYIIVRKGNEKERKPRGRPVTGTKKTFGGRPCNYYSLTSSGKALLREDAEIRERYSEQLDKKSFFEKEDFQVFNDLEHSIWENPKLKNYISNYSTELFIDSLQGAAFRPFVLGNKFGGRDITLYDELLSVMKLSVPSEFIVSYFIALEEWRSEIDELLNCYNILMSKMASLPEVQNYLAKKSK
jgi:hypothetical protein